jgi:hypothetical protein
MILFLTEPAKLTKPLVFFRKSGFVSETTKPRVSGARGLYLLFYFLKILKRQTPEYYYEYPYFVDNQALAAS